MTVIIIIIITIIIALRFVSNDVKKTINFN